jgi:CheY-like chemotaxis protein
VAVSVRVEGHVAMRTILAVDDDDLLRDILEMILGKVEGWEVTTVEDGSRLLAALAHLQPSLIVLDVHLRGLSGVDMYRLLREREDTRDVPVVFLTVASHDVREAQLSGRYGCLEKPFAVEVLVAKVAEMMGVPAPRI